MASTAILIRNPSCERGTHSRANPALQGQTETRRLDIFLESMDKSIYAFAEELSGKENCSTS
jgi:hypothetical protein